MTEIIKNFLNKVHSDVKNLFSKGAIHLFFSMVIVKLLGFPVQIFLARYLGPESMGHIAVINSVLNFGIIFSVMGISTSILKFVSEPVKDEQKRKLLFHGLIIVCITSLITFLVIYIMSSLALLEDKVAGEYLKILSFTVPFTALSSVMVTNFQALKQITRKAKIDLNMRLIQVASFIGGAYFWALDGYIWSRFFIIILTALVVLYAGREYSAKFKVKLSIIRKIGQFGLWSVFAQATLIIVTNSDIIILSYILKDANTVGYYSISKLLIQMMRMLPKSIMDTAFPYLSESGDKKTILRGAYWKIFKRMILMMFSVALLAFLLGGSSIEIVFGTKYLKSIPPFNVLLLGLFFFSIGSPAGRIILAMGKVKINFFISFITGTINIVLNFILIEHMGMIGAAWAVVFTYLFWFIFNKISIYLLLLRNRK